MDISVLPEFIRQQFSTNQFLIGASFTGALVAIFAATRGYIARAFNFFVDTIVAYTTAEFILNGVDELYPQFVVWLSRQKTVNRISSLQIQSDTLDKRATDVANAVNTYSYDISTKRDTRAMIIRIVPFNGTYLIRINGAFFLIRREVKAIGDDTAKMMPAGSNASRFQRMLEKITIRTFRWNTHLLETAFAQIQDIVLVDSKEMSNIFVMNSYNEWSAISPKTKRSINTIFLKEGQVETLLNDLISFRDKESWYIQHGIPYHRGYLLYGPPGTGKSSSIAAIVAHLDYDVYTMNMNKITDEKFVEAVSYVPSHSVLLLEDVDKIGAFTDKEGNTLSFSTVLNTLDGVISKHGLIVFMTTNDIDSLDKAMIRPGRIDVKMELDYCNEYQVRNMVNSFNVDVSESFIKGVVMNKTTPAELQQKLMLLESQ